MASTALESTPAKKEDVPQEFLCPITCEIMSDPHITLSGHTYEKYAIEQWLTTHESDPLTNKKLVNKLLIPNHTLRKQIQSFVERNQIKLRSNKSSPFKYLLRLLRLHANSLKPMHVASNLLQRYSHLFTNNDFSTQRQNQYYAQIIERYLTDWKSYSKQLEAKWIEILASIVYIKEHIYKYHQLNFDSDEEDEEEPEHKAPETMDISELFESHIVKALISIKTSLREIVSIQSNLKFGLEHFFQHTDVKAFVKEKKKRMNQTVSVYDDESEQKNEGNLSLARNGDDDEDESAGFFGSEFEDDLTAFGMIAGALIGGNACGSTGAAIGSVAGPVGTLFGAAIGFYIGAIAGSTPSMLYGIYVESEKMKQKEIDRLWKLIYFGFKKHHNWVDKERNEFNVCDQIIMQSMQSILHCIDEQRKESKSGQNSVQQKKNYNDEEEEDADFVYQSVDDELIEIWQYDISRIVPILQECLEKVE